MVSTAALQFGQQLVDTLLPSTLATGSQLVLSPLLVWFALLLLLNGAGPSTPTYNEILSVVTGGSAAFGGSSLADINTQVAALRAALSRQSAGNNTLTMTDAVWARDIAVNPAFAGDMQRVFKAKVASVPDAAPINEWVANVTNNLIKQAVPPGLAFDMVLTNAIYFKGLWQHPFDKRLTADRPFSVITAGNPNTPQADIMVPTMLQSFGPPSANVSFSEAPGKYKAVRLPYLDSTGLAAVFVLPDASSSSIADAAGAITGESMLDPGTWGPLTDNLDVYLPRFKVEAQLKLTQALQLMGMRAAFDRQADFSRASGTPLRVTDVLQTAVVQVDKAGTEAAAVTSVVGARTSSPPTLAFDRPFLFFLVHTATQTVLFQGTITDPRGSS